jgi:sugar lactone lactonase YvrE
MRLRSRSAFLAAAVAAVVLLPSVASAVDARVVVAFDEQAGQNPEGLAIDARGNTFVSMSFLGQLWRFPAGSTTPTVFGSVSGIGAGDFGLLGLATDRVGNVYGGVQSANPDANGVWRFQHATGAATRIPGSEAMQLANGLAFDARGNLYVTDSRLGAIWRIRPGGAAHVWLQDDALAGDGSLGLFLGANGIAYRNGVLDVTNTERRTLLAVRIRPDGSAGAIRVVADLPANPDGVTMDTAGDAWIALNLANEIVRVSPGGALDVVSSGPPLDFPSSVTFGTTRGERRTLFAVSFSVSEIFGLPGGSGPALVRIPAGVPGMPR